MGAHVNIDYDRFPEQGSNVNQPVNVSFHYDTSVTLPGRIVRDDREDPWRLIILLDDGRYVLATECQYSPRSIR